MSWFTLSKSRKGSVKSTWKMFLASTPWPLEDEKSELMYRRLKLPSNPEKMRPMAVLSLQYGATSEND
jgi:hypothetical protein